MSVNFHDPNFLNAIKTPANGTITLTLRMEIQVDDMTLAPAPGFYICPVVSGQFWSQGGYSCDPRGSGVTVMNVRTVNTFEI